jgi:hypothetical protein
MSDDEKEQLDDGRDPAGRWIKGGRSLDEFRFDDLFDVSEGAPGLTFEELLLCTKWLGANEDAANLALADDLRARADQFEAEDSCFDDRPAIWRNQAAKIEKRVALERLKRLTPVRNRREGINADAEARETVLDAIEAQGLPRELNVPTGQREGVIVKAKELGLSVHRIRRVLRGG